MGRVRTLLHAFTIEESAMAGDGWPDLATALRRTEKLLADDPASWGSCIVSVLDVDTGELRWVNAGHPPPLLVRSGGATFLAQQPAGPVLGLDSPTPRAPAHECLTPGDRLLFYTDGLVERRGEALDVGLSRLLAVAGVDAIEGASSEYCDDVLEAMTEGRHIDDIALLTAELRPHPTGRS
jgi:serine phosphatase RsbU (regulator of sigma subunit)